MSLDKLFAPLLDYLNFLVDFARFDNMQQYVFSDGKIQMVHFTNFLLGCVFTTFIMSNWGKFTSKEKIDFLDWKFLFIVPLVLVNAILWQFGVSIASYYFRFSAGSIRDSINVSFATASILLPVRAIHMQIKNATKGIHPTKLLHRLVLIPTYILFFVVSSLCAINYFRFAELYYKLNLIQLLLSIDAYAVLAILFRFIAMQVFILIKQKHFAG